MSREEWKWKIKKERKGILFFELIIASGMISFIIFSLYSAYLQGKIKNIN